jgi:hypothetical protein
MRKSLQPGFLILLFSTIMISMVSCSKELSSPSSNTTGPTTTSTSSTIAVATDSSGTDSVYILQRCDRGFFRDSLAASALPDSVNSYLQASYTGYVFVEAFVIKDSAGTVGGYVVIISFNGKPVGLLFDASGHFQIVLEQRERGDISGPGWHHGGRYGDRDHTHRDTLAITALPAAIRTYMNSNYPSDTLLQALLNRDSSILVISENDGLFANLFTSAGVFVKRVSILPPVVSLNLPVVKNITQDSLPAAGLTYLTTTYPNYVFESAQSVTVRDQLQGYVAIIDANNTKYAVWFDASGKMIVTMSIW